MMKSLKIVASALVAALFTLSVPAAAQDLDGIWLKLKVDARGYKVAPETEAVSKASFKTAGYMHLVWDAEDERYFIDVWTQRTAGVWRKTYRTAAATVGENGHLFVDLYLRADRSDGAYVAGYHTMRFDVRLDKSGNVKSVKIKHLGGEGISGRIAGNATFAGGMRVGGSSVSVAKLPFDPTLQP